MEPEAATAAAAAAKAKPAGAAAGGWPQLIHAGNTSPSMAQVLLLLGSAVYVLELPLPRADLAGLVGRLALNTTNTTTSSSRGDSSTNPSAGGVGGGLLLQQQQVHTSALLGAEVAGAAAALGAGATAACVVQPVTAAGFGGSGAAETHAGVEAAARKVLELLQQQQQQGSVKQQQMAVQAAVDDLIAAMGRVRAQPDQQQQTTSTAVVLSEQYMKAVSVALAERGMWQLLQTFLSLQPLQDLSGTEQLLELLAQHHQYNLLTEVCLHGRDMPAQGLVAALQQILGSVADADADEQQKQQKRERQQQHWRELHAKAADTMAAVEAAAAAMPTMGVGQEGVGSAAAAAALPLVAVAKQVAAAVEGFTSRQVCCHALLASDLDAVELAAALKGLNPTQLSRLLMYLSRWVEKYTKGGLQHCGTARGAWGLPPGVQATLGFNPPTLPSELVTPSWVRVIEWCRVLIDAHLTRLVSLPGAEPVLQQMAQQVGSTAAATARLLPLKGVAEHLAAGAPLPTAAMAASSRYTVELLDLRVTG